MAKKDLLSFLFVESAEAESYESDQRELKIVENLERLFEVAAEAEQTDLESKKTPLAKALSGFGINDADLQLDTEGFVLATDNHDKYVDALTVLGSADAMHKLAEMGWVVTKPGDSAMTNEPPEYRIRFLEITTVAQNDREPKEGTYDDANREEVIKKAQEFAATPMDRDDKLNPVDNEDGKMGKNDTGIGKAKDGADPEKAIHDSAVGKYNKQMWPLCRCAICGSKRHIEPHGTTAHCDKCGKTTEHKPLTFKDGRQVREADSQERAMAEGGDEIEPGTLPGTVILRNMSRNWGKYLRLKEQGWTTLWTGEDSACMLNPTGKIGAQTKEGTPESLDPADVQAIRDALNAEDADEILEFTGTGSMGTAMSMGQPFVGMVKKPKPYGKGTKFKTPGQWTVKQPVVKEQVKRKVHPESVDPIERQAHDFLNEDLPGDDAVGADDESAQEDEAEQAYNDMRTELESGECAVFDDSRANQPTAVVLSGKVLGRIGEGLEFEDFNAALAALNARMEEDKFWPNIYHINDHGNVSLLDKKGNEVISWV